MNSKKIFNWLDYIIRFLFHVLIITTPFVFTWVNEELFEFNKMLFTYTIVLAIAVTWIAKMAISKQFIWKKTFLSIPLMIFLASQTLSTIFSIHPRTSVFGYYTRFNGGLLSSYTYIILYYAFVSNISKKQIKSYLISIFTSGLLASLYAFPEHFGASPSCVLITKQFNVDCWVQDVRTRVFGTFGQPNWLAAFLVMTIPPLVAFLSLATKTAIKTSANLKNKILFFYLAIMFATLIFTKSRSGLISLAVALIFVGLGIIWINYKNSKNLLKSFSLSIKSSKEVLIILTSISLIFGTPYTPSISSLITKQNNRSVNREEIPVANTLEQGGTESGNIRKIVWKGAFKIWQRYPILGSGVETFAYSYYQDRPIEHNSISEWDFLYNKAHNEFLNFLATTGIVGLISYLLIIITPILSGLLNIQKSSKNISNNNVDQVITIGLIGSIIGISLSNFFGFSTVMANVLLFLFFAILSVITDTKNIKTAKIEIKKENISIEQYLWIGSLLMILFVGWSSIYRIWQADKFYAQGKGLVKSGQYIDGIDQLQKAINLSPKEAFFYDDLSDSYSKLAVAYAKSGQATQSSEVAQAAIQTSQYTLQLNPRHLNFYKTQSRVFINLAQLDSQLLEYAKQTLEKSIELAPTDAKLMYNLGVVEIGLNNTEAGIKNLNQSIEMKPNYAAARFYLGKQYEQQQNLPEAKEQYKYILDHIIPNHPESQERLITIEASLSAQTP